MKMCFFILLLSSMAIAEPKEKTAFSIAVYSGSEKVGDFVSYKKPTYANGVCTFNYLGGPEVSVGGTFVVVEISVSDIPAPAKKAQAQPTPEGARKRMRELGLNPDEWEEVPLKSR